MGDPPGAVFLGRDGSANQHLMGLWYDKVRFVVSTMPVKCERSLGSDLEGAS